MRAKTEKEGAVVMKRILDIIIENSDRRLDAVLYNDAEYRRLEREISGKTHGLEKENLTRRQNRAVDRLLTAYNEESARCCRLLYEQGFKDCISLLKEIGVA